LARLTPSRSDALSFCCHVTADYTAFLANRLA
jgi:hypothetical protein